MTDDRERWALILGASSGMGEATARTLAANGYKIAGIHLDFRAGLAHVDELKAAIEAAGSEALYINMNAADDEKRAAAIQTLRERFDRSRAEGKQPYVRVLMHSLAFGSKAVDHPVVHPDQAVDLGLSHVEEARGVVAVVQKLCALGDEGERPEHASHEHDAGRERRHEHCLDGKQPQAVLAKEVDASGCQ